MGRRVGPPFGLQGMLLRFYLRLRTIFDFPSDIYFRISGLYPRFQTFPALGLDYRLLPSFSVSFSDTLRTSNPPDHSHFRFPIPNTICVSIPLARDNSDTSYAQEPSPRPSTTFPGTATLSAPIPFQSPILSAHHPLNPSDFRTSQIPPAPGSLYIPT